MTGVLQKRAEKTKAPASPKKGWLAPLFALKSSCELVGAATEGAAAAIGAAELSPLEEWLAKTGLNVVRSGTTMATVEGLQSAGRQDWSDPGTATAAFGFTRAGGARLALTGLRSRYTIL